MFKILLFMLFVMSLNFHKSHVNAGRRKRIVGGDLIDIESAPYIVSSTKISLEYMDRQICGGAVLNENWVITAAHCFGKVFNIDKALIRVGTIIRRTNGTEHRPLEIIKYPDFQMNIVDNDVGLVKLDPPLKFSNKVQPIRLPGASKRPQVGDMLTVLGWGYTKEKGTPSTYLRGVSLPVYPHEECKEIYRTTLNVTSQMMCLGFRDGGSDACVLDSGGPLVGNGILLGLVSWGWGCARALRPGVYTDLSAPQVRNWILSIITA